MKSFNGDERGRENVHAITMMVGTLFPAVVVTRTMSFVLQRDDKKSFDGETRERGRERENMYETTRNVCCSSSTRTMDFLFELQQRDYDMKKSKH